MASKNVDIRINTTADPTGAKQATAALNSLATSAGQAASKADAVTTSASKLGQRAGAVGLQIQDIAVQAQSGTSAVTILAQQGTQIASIFGPQGAIVGALLGVGAVAAKVFYDMAKASAVTGEAMEDMSDKLKDAFGDQAKKLVQQFNEELKNQTTFGQELRQMEINLMQARMDREGADKALIASQAELQTAAVKYLESTGQIVNAEKELAAIRDAAAAANRDAQIQDINNQVEVARARYQAVTAQYQDVQAETDAAQKRLSELEARQQEIMGNLTFSRQQDRNLQKAGALKKDESSLQTRALQGELDGLKAQIDGVIQVIQGAPQRLQEATQQAIAAGAELDVVLSGAESQISTINEQFNSQQSAQAITTATQDLTQGAKEIQATVSEFQAVTPVQQQAKEAIIKAVEDGKITAQEQVQIGQNLSLLMSTLKEGQGSSIKTLQELIRLNDDMALQMQSANNEIRALRTKVQALQGVR